MPGSDRCTPSCTAPAAPLPAGCGETVGIAGLTLGGGIGLLGRRYGLTCDRLRAARVVLADGRIVDCDQGREPDLFWALRGAGGGQFGVVTSLTFETVAEPVMTRFELRWGPDHAAELVEAWQQWAPHAPEELTANLTLAAEPDRDLEVIVFGASMLDEEATRGLLDVLSRSRLRSGRTSGRACRTASSSGASPSSTRARTPRRGSGSARSCSPHRCAPPRSTRSWRPSRTGRPASPATSPSSRWAAPTTGSPPTPPRSRTGGRGSTSSTPAPSPGPWVDRSWEIAHADGSGGVYANFPDLALHDGPAAYHRANLERLARVKRAYDADDFFAFPQSIRPDSEPDPEESA